MIRLKRVYDTPSASDGTRILVDRLWPRGVSKASARVDDWRRDLAPSAELRVWYGHEPAKFARFREQYRLELFRRRDELASLAIQGEREPLTLLYAAREPQTSNAVVLKELLEEVLEGGPPREVPLRRRSTRSARPPARAARSRSRR
jgi:uncharacterized protein YeaO (DUF488 family)